MILRNARIGDSLVDITVSAGVIEAVGATGAIGAGPGESLLTHGEEVDLDGRWVIPGLWDFHTHFSQWALHSRRLDLSGVDSARDAALAVANAMANSLPSEDTFTGGGFRDGLWADAPNLAELDAASGRRPVVLVSGDLHCVWLNTAALERYGHAGHPTGLLREGDAFAVVQKLEVVSDDSLDEWADAAAREAAKRGVVGIVDFEMAWNLDPWTRRIDSGTRSVRVEFGIYTENLDRAIDLGLRTGDEVNDRLTVGHFKILTDGSLNTRTAYCYDEYPGFEGQPGSRGILTVEPDRLLPLMRLASDAGILPAVHAIGDRANSLALDAFEAIGCHGRIEHAQLLLDADLPRFAKLGVEASVQPDHAMDDRDVADHYWAGRTGRAFALRSLFDAGATLRLGSDAPVSSLDPWNTIAAAVGRSRDGREPWHPEQSISVREALDASSRSTLRKGQPADVVVLDRDPERSTVDELRILPVVATMLGGEFTHRAL